MSISKLPKPNISASMPPFKQVSSGDELNNDSKHDGSEAQFVPVFLSGVLLGYLLAVWIFS